jgi:hypothetical protein
MPSLVISYLYQRLFPFAFKTLCFGTDLHLLRGFSAIKLCYDLGINPIELFLRENTQKRPSKI